MKHFKSNCYSFVILSLVIVVVLITLSSAGAPREGGGSTWTARNAPRLFRTSQWTQIVSRPLLYWTPQGSLGLLRCDSSGDSPMEW